MNDIEKALRGMDPQEAARQAATALRQLLPLLGEEERSSFIMTLLGGGEEDKISSMVHL